MITCVAFVRVVLQFWDFLPVRNAVVQEKDKEGKTRSIVVEERECTRARTREEEEEKEEYVQIQSIGHPVIERYENMHVATLTPSEVFPTSCSCAEFSI